MVVSGGGEVVLPPHTCIEMAPTVAGEGEGEW